MATLGDLNDIRQGIANNLATITGLRAAPDVGQTVKPPMALVGLPKGIEFDTTMGRGSDGWTMPFRLYVGTAAARASVKRLASYIAKSGSSSVKVAVESDVTLGGAAQTCRLSRMSDAGFITIGNTQYIVVDFEVEVTA